MILEVRINNYRAYSGGVALSMSADGSIVEHKGNVHSESGFDVLKSACLYGPNNSGKSCFVKAVDSIRHVLLNVSADVSPNIFADSKICSMGVSFLFGGEAFSYDFKYDSATVSGFMRGIVYERFLRLHPGGSGNVDEEQLFLRDLGKSEYAFAGDERLEGILDMFSANNILIYCVNAGSHPLIEKYKDILRGFALGVDVLNMNRIPLNKTIGILKYDDPMKREVVDIIRRADLEIENFDYLKDRNYARVGVLSNSESGAPDTGDVVTENISAEDMLRLVSVHKGKHVQSLSFDSDGTHAVVALASYIADALEKGRTLVVDELDNGLHFRLAMEIVSLFNDEKNVSGQLIFTAHDVSLLNCDTLFRRDQIWFVEKEGDVRRLVSLFGVGGEHANGSSEGGVPEGYMRGDFGALPEPDMKRAIFKAEETHKGSDGDDPPLSISMEEPVKRAGV